MTIYSKKLVEVVNVIETLASPDIYDQFGTFTHEDGSNQFT